MVMMTSMAFTPAKSAFIARSAARREAASRFSMENRRVRTKLSAHSNIVQVTTSFSVVILPSKILPDAEAPTQAASGSPCSTI